MIVICGMTTFLLDFTFTSGFSRGKKTPMKLVSLWEISSVKQASVVGPGVRLIVQEKEMGLAESSPNCWWASTPPIRRLLPDSEQESHRAQVQGQGEAMKAGPACPTAEDSGAQFAKVSRLGASSLYRT